MNKPHHLKFRLFLSFFLFVSVSAFAQPGNDACAAATTLTAGTTCTNTGGTLYQATASGSPTSPYGTTYDVWYKFTGTATINSVQITLSSTGAGITNSNTFIEAFNTSTCGGISTTTSLGEATRQTGLVVSNINASNTIYFRVYTIVNPTSAAGNWSFNVCVARTNAAPGNDNCAGATLLTVGTINNSGRLDNATATTGITVGCATGNPDDDVWYRFSATSTSANITVNPNSYNNTSSSTLAAGGAMIQLFTGACGSLVSKGCGVRGSMLATGLSVGTTYYFRVYSYGTTGTDIAAAPPVGNTFSVLVSTPTSATVTSSRTNEIFRQTTLSDATLLNDPWEVTYGPDGYLWITESKGYRVLRMDPATGERSTVLELGRNSNFFTTAGDKAFNMDYELAISSPQGGMAGLAIHPDFVNKPYVYVSYIYTFNGGSQPTGVYYTNRVVRFTYNTSTNRLESPVSLCDTLPGSSDHNSQRMVIAPVGGTDYLFYAAGDMGAGQFGNATRIIKAQHLRAYEGKILRFNLEPDADAGTLDKWIPNDNPFNATLGVQSAVWAYGIRNNQGFVYDPVNDKLYGSSHGPYSDDEINIIESAKNYGHPLVIGYAADDNVNSTTAGAAPGMSPPHPSSCPVITDESTNAANLGAAYKDPLFSAYPNSPAVPSITNLWNTTTGANGQWPSEGWSGLDLYTSTVIPGWKQSLVAASLKWGRLVKIKLNNAGTAVIPWAGGDTTSYFGSTNRFRDLAFAPNGRDMFVIMDRSSTTSGPSAGNPIVPACGGCLQKYTFLGYNDAGGKSSIDNRIPVSTGTVNTCVSGTTVTIDAANNNTNIWVPITGPDGNILAEIYANGNSLGQVTSSFYMHSGATRVRNGSRYLNRNITITPATQPGSAVKVRFYFTKAEYDALDADALSGVNAITDVKILKNSDPCGPNVASNTTLVTPTFAEVFGTNNGYMVQGNITSFSTFYFGNSNITLPLELLSFRGNLQSSATLLQWQTANETNTSRFIVERSIDNNNFNAIGTVAAAGNSTANQNYSYTDNEVMQLPALVVYYRLKMVDNDGSFTYSNTITITLADIAGKVSAFPNPATHDVKLTVTAGADAKGQWKIIDNAGQVVMQNGMNLKKGTNTVTINVHKLAAGMYYLSVSGGDVDQKIKLQKL